MRSSGIEGGRPATSCACVFAKGVLPFFVLARDLSRKPINLDDPSDGGKIVALAFGCARERDDGKTNCCWLDAEGDMGDEEGLERDVEDAERRRMGMGGEIRDDDATALGMATESCPASCVSTAALGFFFLNLKLMALVLLLPLPFAGTALEREEGNMKAWACVLDGLATGDADCDDTELCDDAELAGLDEELR